MSAPPPYYSTPYTVRRSVHPPKPSYRNTPKLAPLTPAMPDVSMDALCPPATTGFVRAILPVAYG